jgi:hypothetical protein
MYFSGSSVRAAISFNKHIVALEPDSAIFEDILRPLQETTKKIEALQIHNEAEEDDNEEDVPEEDEVNLCE